jgi:hypothetical protein
VLVGQRIRARGYDPLADAYGCGELEKILAPLRRVIAEATSAMPTPQHYRQRHCRAVAVK